MDIKAPKTFGKSGELQFSTEPKPSAPPPNDGMHEDKLSIQTCIRASASQSSTAPFKPPELPPKKTRGPADLWPGRSQLQEITPGLLITNYFGAKNQRALQDGGISHIVVCASELPETYPGRFSYLKLTGLTDNTNTVLLPQIEKALPWIKSAISNGGRVLLHCASGSSRSGAILIAYLMWDQHISAEEAIRRATSARPIIAPNPGFLEQLKAFESTKIKNL